MRISYAEETRQSHSEFVRQQVPPHPIRTNEVMDELQELKDQIAACCDCIGQLRGMLKPILCQEPCGVAADTTNVADDGLCELAAGIKEGRLNLTLCNQHLFEIMSRIRL